MVEDKHGNKIIVFTFVKGNDLEISLIIDDFLLNNIGKVASEIFVKNLGSKENLKFLFNLGSTLAKLQKNLHGFFHPHAKGKRVILWDIQHLSKVRSLIVPSLNQKDLIESFITDFETFYLPLLPKLRSQVCMNDLHLDNVIVDNNLHIQGTFPYLDSLYLYCIGYSNHIISLLHLQRIKSCQFLFLQTKQFRGD